MVLTPMDAALFYRLWLPMLDYVNNEYKVNPGIGRLSDAESIDPAEVMVIAEYVWSHPTVIDEYLACAGLPEEHHEIVAGWKRCRRGTYILERNLKKGSVFISAEDAEVYMVLGLFSAWEEMFGYRPLPVMMEAVLLPFRDKIITDGLVIPYNIVFGRGAAADFKDTYMDAKKSGKILFSQ